MEGIITSFRRGRRTQTPNQVIIEVNVKDPSALIGKAVEWLSPAKKSIKGKITALHGKNRLRAILEKGMPGQALGQKISIS